jgi:hypothetical protein
VSSHDRIRRLDQMDELTLPGGYEMDAMEGPHAADPEPLDPLLREEFGDKITDGPANDDPDAGCGD